MVHMVIFIDIPALVYFLRSGATGTRNEVVHITGRKGSQKRKSGTFSTMSREKYHCGGDQVVVCSNLPPPFDATRVSDWMQLEPLLTLRDERLMRSNCWGIGKLVPYSTRIAQEQTIALLHEYYAGLRKAYVSFSAFDFFGD